MSRARSIPTSRLLVGILLHFCVPAYLLFCLAAALLRTPVVAGWADLPARMLWTAAWFVPGFLAAIGAAAAIGTLVDRRQPAAPDPIAASSEASNEGRRLLAGLADARLDRALARLDDARWDHADARHQRIAADLLATGRTFAAAHRSAKEGEAAIGALAADSVERLVDALMSLAEERRRLDEGDAKTVAGYLAARYGDDPA